MAGTSFPFKSLLLQDQTTFEGLLTRQNSEQSPIFPSRLKRKPVMDGSVLGALRLDDSDCLRSGIFGEEADVLVFVSAVEGIPSPSLARVCFLFEC